MERISPDYMRIYSDIIDQLFPERRIQFRKFFNKKDWSALNVIKLNTKMFGDSGQQISQKHRAYSESDIIEILHYRKKNKLNNSVLARYFKLSRNTVVKCRKIYNV